MLYNLCVEIPRELERDERAKKRGLLRALSVRQPYAELIMRGEKTVEYRSKPTNVRGRVYVYAAKKPGEVEDFQRAGLRPGALPTGVLMGTTEVVGCTGEQGRYEWHLANPERLAELLRPERHPQPVWFYPFIAYERSPLDMAATTPMGDRL
jgi:hypothetical protein